MHLNNQQISTMKDALKWPNEQIVNLNEQIVNLDEQIFNLNEQIVNLKHLIQNVYACIDELGNMVI